ncbi:MAG: prepilin-type N-terminal cleavage/methylation domain-containing protein [Candidatus Omnitrophota bacterium]
MNKKRAFSLIELMVVIAIIGVLTAMLVPQVQDFAARARDTRRLSDIKNIASAVIQYKMDYGRVPETPEGVSDAGEYVGNGGSFENAIQPIIGEVISPDPLWNRDSSTYYYYYDPRHCSDILGLGPNNAAVLSFQTAETTTVELKRETTCGGDGGQNVAAYNDVILW